MSDRASPLVVAVDGPAASGKGTISRRIAGRFQLAYLDTGLLYRAVGAKMLEAGLPLNDQEAAARMARGLEQPDFHRQDLRLPATARAASIIAQIPQVRQALLEYQRWFARNPLGGMRGAVLDGRDIGTVICPDATVKLFITASPEERARRRCAELAQGGNPADYATVLSDVIARDKRDRERASAPLRQADDAHLLDTTNLAIDEAVAKAAEILEPYLR
ncbi:MAG: (d)CMP kinase [Neomegalonema sp.]|nr:(d)CMP kinase [Neomegalonema sp.]